MEKLIIKETFETPGVNFDPEKGVLEIKGRSILADPKDFYKPILKWLHEYRPGKGTKTVVRLQFYYYNTKSTQYILDLLKKTDALYKKGFDVKIKWEYEEGDEDAVSDGEQFGSMLSVPFEVEKV